MIIVQLLGGLGNQLFQYALGRRLSFERRVPLKLDLSWFEQQSLRAFQLDQFQISAKIATPKEITRMTKSNWVGLSHRLYRAYQRRIPYYRQTIVREATPSFDPAILRVPGRVLLVGYWQSETYFQKIASILRDELSLRHAPDEENKLLSAQIHKTLSVSVHIRRGDFTSNPKHGTCPPNYYYNAIDMMANMYKFPHFYVFSDDHDWVKNNINFPYPVTFVTHNGIEGAHKDLMLMKQCKSHIIANSSFSWWGAWLCTNPEKTVIAPKKWFASLKQDTDHLIPATWIRI